MNDRGFLGGAVRYLPPCVDVRVRATAHDSAVVVLSVGEGRDVSAITLAVSGAAKAQAAGHFYAERFHEQLVSRLTAAALALCEYPERFTQ